MYVVSFLIFSVWNCFLTYPFNSYLDFNFVVLYVSVFTSSFHTSEPKTEFTVKFVDWVIAVDALC
jgi:hypothetical protein